MMNEPFHNSVFQTRIKKMRQDSLSINFGINPTLTYLVREYEEKVLEFIAKLRDNFACTIPAQFNFDALMSNFDQLKIQDIRKPFLVEYRVA